jgi:hypothetical protein
MVSTLRSPGVFALATGWLLAATSPAQLPVPAGFADQIRWQQNRLVNLGFDLLPGGDVIAADDLALFRVDAQGGRTDVWSLPSGAMVAFVRVTPDGSAVLVGESSQGRLYRHEVPTGQTRALGTVPFLFDLAFTPQGQAIVSANPLFGTPGAQNQLLLLDVVSGATRLFARIAGPSGPVACAADGALLYATQVMQFPTPPGSLRLLRFAPARLQAALNGGPLLGEADATVLASQLDGAYALVPDEQGRVYVSDPSHGGIRRFDAAGRGEDFLPVTGSHFETVLRFRWRGPGAFAPCQPDGSAELWCVETDWRHGTRLRSIAPQRPQAFHAPVNPVPAGRLDMFVTGAPPLGRALCLVSRGLLSAEQHALLAGGVPLWFGLDPARLVLTSWQPVDAAGAASVAFTVPPGVVDDLGCQWLVASPDQGTLATSWPVPLQFR